MLLGCLKSLLCKECCRVLHFKYYFYDLLDSCMNLCQFVVAVEGVENMTMVSTTCQWKQASKWTSPLHISSTKYSHFPVNHPTNAKCNRCVNTGTEEIGLKFFDWYLYSVFYEYVESSAQPVCQRTDHRLRDPISVITHFWQNVLLLCFVFVGQCSVSGFLFSLNCVVTNNYMH